MNFGAVPRVSNGFDDNSGDGNDFEALVFGKSKSSPLQESFDPWGTSSNATQSLQPSISSASQRTSPTPTFSWATPIAPQQQQPLSNLSRHHSPAASTSNHNSLGSFGVLQPQPKTSSTSSFMTPITPMPVSPPANAGSGLDWSSSMNNGWSTNILTPNSSSAANPWAAPQQPVQSTSSFGLPPPTNTIAAGLGSYSTFNIAPPPPINGGGFGTGLGQRPNGQQAQQPQQQQQQQKSGLDKYQSLI
jgi:SCY1-like protein 2